MTKDLNPGDTIIAEGVKVEGDLSSEHNIWINGTLKGNVTAKGTVTIAAAAQVEADITAHTIVIAGQLKGKVSAQATLSLHDSAHHEGDITAKEIMVARGAQLNGQIVTSQPASAQKSRK